MERFHVFAPVALALLTACSSPGPGPDRERGAGRGEPEAGADLPRRGAGGGFNSAARLVDEGRYAMALPILRCIAGQGTGYEIAQYLAGHSALELSEAADTPDILRPELRVEGFDRLLSAANAGWPSAQAELVRWFADTPGPEALQQASYWAAVYRKNARDRAYGLDRLSDTLEAAIETRAGEEASRDAEMRAEGFVVRPMAAEDTPPECARFLRQAAPQGMGVERRRGGNGEGRRRGGGGRSPG